MALMPVVAKDLVAGGPATYGLLLGAFGVGAVGGAFCIAHLRRRLSTESTVQWAGGALVLAIALVGLSTHLAITMAALVVAGAGWVLTLATFNVTVQMSAPRWVVARALALYQMAAFGGVAAGSWLWGECAADIGVRSTLLIASAAMLISAPLPVAAVVALGRAELDPLHRAQEHTAGLRRARARSSYRSVRDPRGGCSNSGRWASGAGSVVATARATGVVAPSSNPQLWIERYETPTWLDYLRLNSRLTQDDAVVPERLRALHRGPAGPRVRRMLERQTSSLPAEQRLATEDHIEPPHGP